MEQIEYFPLSQLKIAPENVRKTSPTTIADLAASIKAQGLKQNLVGYRKGNEVMVSAGGRRLTALLALEKDGALPEELAANGVPVLISDSASAYETSLAENTVREAMHPADEFEAFAALERAGLSVAQIATRFGCTEQHVEKRMRLARVAPSILAEYRAGKLNLDQVMAFAVVDNQEQQLKVLKGARAAYEREPQRIREALLAKEVVADSPLGKFVGVRAYEAAGGEVRRDLFSDTVSFPDAKLVDRLAIEKLEAEAEKHRKKGWGWVEVRPDFPWRERHKYQQRYNAKPSANLGVIVTVCETAPVVQVLEGLIKPGQKQSETKPKAQRQATGKNAAALRELRDELRGIRAAAIRHSFKTGEFVALASLTASLAAQLFDLRHEPAEEVVNVCFNAVGSVTKAVAKADPKAGAEHKDWEKRCRAGAKKHGSILKWLVSQPIQVTNALLAYITASSVSTDTWDEKGEAMVHAFASDLEINLAAGWQLTQAWVGKQPKAYILEAVTEVAGAAQAKVLEKEAKPKDFAMQAHAVLSKHGWQPKELRQASPKRPQKPKKQAAKKTAPTGRKAAAASKARPPAKKAPQP